MCRQNLVSVLTLLSIIWLPCIACEEVSEDKRLKERANTDLQEEVVDSIPVDDEEEGPEVVEDEESTPNPDQGEGRQESEPPQEAPEEEVSEEQFPEEEASKENAPEEKEEPVDLPPDLRLVFERFDPSTLETSLGEDKRCTSAIFRALQNDQGVAAIEARISAIRHNGRPLGTVEEPRVMSDSEGYIVARYCSGDLPERILVRARVGDQKMDSKHLEIIRVVRPNLVYLGSNLTPGDEQREVSLNLWDSGPDDCGQLKFQLTDHGAPMPLRQVEFITRGPLPMGAKLGERDEHVLLNQIEEDRILHAFYQGETNVDGIVEVPVCGGSQPGNFLVEAFMFGKPEIKAESALIVVSSGITSYRNFSLTFDTTNARTLNGQLNNNSEKPLFFTANLKTQNDGRVMEDFPLLVATEIGEVTKDNGGYIKKDTGNVKFSVEPLHLSTTRPFPVHTFESSAAQTTCDPIAISQAGGMTFEALSRNWRSTMVYAVMGQEAYHDANQNGQYDPGGDGFWDKNQNGEFDEGIDVLTFDANDDGFDRHGEYFIDLPSPFVDTDENGIYDPDRDRLMVGHQYVPPNGQRDRDTMIWRSVYLPVYLGVSAYSMGHPEIEAGTIGPYQGTMATDYYQMMAGSGLRPSLEDLPTTLFMGASIGQELLWPGAMNDDELQVRSHPQTFHLFAHGICGNPMPGGSTIKIDFAPITRPSYGERELTGHIYNQPGDYIRESHRRFLSESDGSAEAIVNFNVEDHPSRSAGYPVEFEIRVGPCNQACEGEMFNKLEPGFACDAQDVEAKVTLMEQL